MYMIAYIIKQTKSRFRKKIYLNQVTEENKYCEKNKCRKLFINWCLTCWYFEYFNNFFTFSYYYFFETKISKARLLDITVHHIHMDPQNVRKKWKLCFQNVLKQSVFFINLSATNSSSFTFFTSCTCPSSLATSRHWTWRPWRSLSCPIVKFY